ncbi:hypothetical protein KSS87_005400 [Heliosperma pusillum]|nr:hypothetical protein KSS87_005400 [Heliosperma pusillum]
MTDIAHHFTSPCIHYHSKTKKLIDGLRLALHSSVLTTASLELAGTPLL